MSKHLEAATAHRAIAGVYGVVFAVVIVIALAASDGRAWPLIFIATPVSGFFIALHLVIAKGADNCRPWARAASLIVGFALLVGFPIGTALGIWVLINSFSEWTPPKRMSSALIDGWPQVERERA